LYNKPKCAIDRETYEKQYQSGYITFNVLRIEVAMYTMREEPIGILLGVFNNDTEKGQKHQDKKDVYESAF
jgi:hypothetical protein